MNELEHDCGHDHFRSAAHYAATFDSVVMGLAKVEGEVRAARCLLAKRAEFMAELRQIVQDELKAKFRNVNEVPMAMMSRELEPEHAEYVERRLQELVADARDAAMVAIYRKRLNNPPNGGRN